MDIDDLKTLIHAVIDVIDNNYDKEEIMDKFLDIAYEMGRKDQIKIDKANQTNYDERSLIR